MNVRIEDIAVYLPKKCVTNQALHEEYPHWQMSRVAARAGVQQRFIADQDETALDLSIEAVKNLFQKHENLRSRVDGLLFCTQSADYIMPPNACLLHRYLELPENVFAMDFTLACSGYVYGLAMARGLLQSKSATNILLVNADTYSKYIYPQDRSTRALFGDGAAVSWLTVSDERRGIMDIACATAGDHYDKFIIRAGGCRTPKSVKTARLVEDDSGNRRTDETIYMDGYGILKFVSSKVPQQIHAVLGRNHMTVNDVDCFVFHQASKMVLDTLTRLLRLPKEKVYSNIERVGNTVSASIPIALKQAMDEDRVMKGHKVLLSGFGVGLSWGTALLEL